MAKQKLKPAPRSGPGDANLYRTIACHVDVDFYQGMLVHHEGGVRNLGWGDDRSGVEVSQSHNGVKPAYSAMTKLHGIHSNCWQRHWLNSSTKARMFVHYNANTPASSCAECCQCDHVCNAEKFCRQAAMQFCKA